MARKELLLRLDPDLADDLQLQAFACGRSRNALIADVLQWWADVCVVRPEPPAEEKP